MKIVPATTAAIRIGDEIAALAVEEQRRDQRSHFPSAGGIFLLGCGSKTSEKSLNPLGKIVFALGKSPDPLEKLSIHWKNSQTHWKNPWTLWKNPQTHSKNPQTHWKSSSRNRLAANPMEKRQLAAGLDELDGRPA
jgi:hypothetical protein